MTDHNMDDMSDEEVYSVVQAAIGELLNIASGVAELQGTDESAEEIYTICDLVAEYHGIDRSVAVTTENEDGSYTTRFEDPDHSHIPVQPTKHTSIPGSIRTSGKPKLRVKDKDTPLDLDPNSDDE